MLSTTEQNTAATVQAKKAASQSPVERDIALAAEQYRKAVEKFDSKSVQDMQSADVQTDLEQNTGSQTAGDIPAHTSLETLEQSELDWDPYELSFGCI